MRKEIYLETINTGITKLLAFQDLISKSRTEGCFYYPYWSLRRENFVNSRWQEAVFSLSWFYNKYNSEDLWNRIIKGIDFWCKLQHKNGAFPEYSKLDRSFSATVFSSLAILNSIILLNYSKEKWLEKIHKSAKYLMKNDELILINEEAAAALFLLKFGNYTNNLNYLSESERKLNRVLQSQAPKGYYMERNGFNLGKSSLTLELLGHYYLITENQRIHKSASRFIDLITNINLRPELKTNVNVSGFEIFCDKTQNGREALRKILDNFNVLLFRTDNDLCTNFFDLCSAYDNSKEEFEHRNFEKDLFIENKQVIKRPSKLFNILRPFGIHKFRKLKYQLI